MEILNEILLSTVLAMQWHSPPRTHLFSSYMTIIIAPYTRRELTTNGSKKIQKSSNCFGQLVSQIKNPKDNLWAHMMAEWAQENDRTPHNLVTFGGNENIRFVDILQLQEVQLY